MPGSLMVCTADRMLSLIDLRLEGRKRMEIEVFLRGYEISSGETFD
jgi:hypothetical protein